MVPRGASTEIRKILTKSFGTLSSIRSRVGVHHFCMENSDCGFPPHSLSAGLVLHFSSGDLEPHHFGKPAPRAFQFGMVEFLRNAFGLPTVQSNSLAAGAASGQFRGEPLVPALVVGNRLANYSYMYFFTNLVNSIPLQLYIIYNAADDSIRIRKVVLY